MDGLQIIQQAYRLHRTQEMLFKPILQQYNLRQSELDVLLCLHANPDCRTAGAVAESRMMPKSLISTSVVTLTQRGLIECRVDLSDRRRVLLTLLPEASPVIEAARSRTEQLLRLLNDTLTETEIAAAERVFALLSENICLLGADEDLPCGR